MAIETGRNIQRVAWGVLLAAFCLFVALLLGLPWLGLQYVRAATDAQQATVECKTDGDVQIETGEDAIAVLSVDDGPRVVGEGTRIVTRRNAKALLSFFDRSTLHLEPFTRVVLQSMRRPRFGVGDQLSRILLDAEPEPGRVAQLSVGATASRREFRIRTPQATVDVAPETKACLYIGADALTVATIVGGADVTSPGRTVHLGPDQRTQVPTGGMPDTPIARIHNLVRNGDFRAGQGSGEIADWRFRQDDFGADENEGVPPADTLGTGWSAVDGRTVVRFARRESGGRPADMLFEQDLRDYELNTGVCGATYVGVTARLRVLNQSIPGGGTRNTEYPVRLKLVLEDQIGNELAWNVGFFAVTPDPGTNPADTQYSTASGFLVPQGEWTTFDSGNLLEGKTPTSFLNPAFTEPYTNQIAKILRLEVIASGHDYESEVDSVGVWVK